MQNLYGLIANSHTLYIIKNVIKFHYHKHFTTMHWHLIKYKVANYLSFIKDHVSINKVHKYISKYIDPYTKCGWSCHWSVYNINVSVNNAVYAISRMSLDAFYDNYTILKCWWMIKMQPLCCTRWIRCDLHKQKRKTQSWTTKFIWFFVSKIELLKCIMIFFLMKIYNIKLP